MTSTASNDKSHKHSKHYSSRTNSNRSLTSTRKKKKIFFFIEFFFYIETRSTTSSVYIHISSSSYRLWTSNILIYLLFFYQFRIIYR
jgi:hypothetical protein